MGRASFDTATIKDNDTCEDRVLLKDNEKKKSTTTASDIGGGERITRRCATISTLKYPPSQYDNTSNKMKASKKDVNIKASVVTGSGGRTRQRRQRGSTTAASLPNNRQHTSSPMSKRSTDMVAPFSPLSQNIKAAAAGGRTKSRRFRVKEGTVGGKKDVQMNLFSPSASIDFYADLSDSGSEYEEEDDASTFSYNSADDGKKPRAQSTKKKGQKRKMNELDESHESKPPAKKRTG